MSDAKRHLKPVEAIFVIAGLAIGALCLYGGYRWVAAVMHRRAVAAAIPAYVEGLKLQRDKLGAAIERYHSAFGFYPPAGKPESKTLNALYYELAGTRWNEKTATLGLPTMKEPVDRSAMEKILKIGSFSNSLAFPAWPTNFLNGTGQVGRQEGEIMLVVSGTPEGVSDDVADDFTVTTWRYAANPAEHNRGKFDLSMEVEALGQKFKIQNW